MDKPFHLQNWIATNRNLLHPPLGNKIIYQDAKDYMIMVVGGPNHRKDFHYNETEELFYQIEGDIVVKVQENNQLKEITIREGEMFLLPAKVPHQPIRSKNTIGLVIEKKRTLQDGLMWYCEKCNALLQSYRFYVKDITKDFLPYFKDFYTSEILRTCRKCGAIMNPDERHI